MALSSPRKSPARSCRTCGQPIHSRDVYYNLARKGNRDLANSLRRLCPSLPPGFPDLICYGCNKDVGKVQTGYRKIETLRAKYENSKFQTLHLQEEKSCCICRSPSKQEYCLRRNISLCRSLQKVFPGAAFLGKICRACKSLVDASEATSVPKKNILFDNHTQKIV